MDISSFLLTNILNGLLAVALLLGGFKLFDFLTPKWDFGEAFNGSNFTGGSIVVAAFLLGLALVISSASF